MGDPKVSIWTEMPVRVHDHHPGPIERKTGAGERFE
jgi:hypothetical protein